MAEGKSCFVISPIGESDSDTRKRADQILKHVIKPAVSECGYVAERADEIDKPGIITSQVIQRVVTDSLVVADLTERNPNVFYELAIRHALRKPLIQLIKKGERIPFDVAGTRTIQVDHRDLDSVESAKREIVAQIKSLEADPSDLETPISVSLDLQILRQSEKPEERSLADLVSLVADLRAGIAKLDNRIGGGDDGERGVLDDISKSLHVLRRRVDESIDRPFGVGRMRRQRWHPMMLREIALGANDQPERAILVVASLFRESLPWIYELGIEAYRAVRDRPGDAHEAVQQFREIIDFTLHSDLGREVIGRSKEMFLLLESVDSVLHDLNEMLDDGP